MRIVLRRWFAALAILATLQGAAAADLDAPRIAADAAILTAISDRGQGQPGAASAAAWIAGRLAGMGVEVHATVTTVSVPVDHGSTLTAADGSVIPLTPLAPNLAATPGTGGEELRGPLFHGGDGSFTALHGMPAGAVVVLDASSREGWTRAANLGASAVIITGTPDRVRLAALSVPASLPFPRFIATLPAGLSGTVAVRSLVVWESRSATSVVAIIPGRAASGDQAGEAMLLAAGYEANGGIPGPGAHRAWNAALLLEVVRSLAAAPAGRTVVAVFHGGRGEAFRGLREIAGALMTDRDRSGIAEADDDRLLQVRNHSTNLADGAEAARRALLAEAGGGDPAGLRERLHAAMSELEWREDSLVVEKGPASETLPARILSLAVAEHADRLMPALERLRERLKPRGSTAALSPATRQILDDAEQGQRAWRSLQLKLEGDRPLTADEARMAQGLAATAALMAAAQRDHHLRRVGDYGSLLALRTRLTAVQCQQLVAFDLSDGGERWAPFGLGAYQSWKRDVNGIHSVAGDVAAAILRADPDAACDPAPFRIPNDTGSWWTADYQHEAAFTGPFIWSVTISTTGDSRQRHGSPADARLDLARLDRQVRGMDAFLRRWIDLPEWGARRMAQKMDRSRFTVPTLAMEQRSVGSKSGVRGAPFPLSFLGWTSRGEWFGDVSGVETRRGDLFGEDIVPFIMRTRPEGYGNLPIRSYQFDDHGRIRSALMTHGQQSPSKDLSFTFSLGKKVTNVRGKLFDGVSSRVHGAFDPRLLAYMPSVRPLAASRESMPLYGSVESADGQVGILTEMMPLRFAAGADKLGNRMLILGRPDPDREGRFIGISPGLLARHSALETAADMWTLNDQRMEQQRRSGIDSDSLVALHAQAQRLLESASAAALSGDHARAEGLAQGSWAISTRVYPRVLSTANDVVVGLVVLLLFTLPFSVIVERLILASDTVGRRVGGFGAVFGLVFLFFYALHPAFDIATTPAVIFLAFMILLVSGWVIVVIYNRFEVEMKHIRQEGAGVHQADVSRLGTLFATVGLGISNMRRRPLRTLLTWLTVCLMTFILLTFASFSPATGVQRLGQDSVPPWQGVLVRQNGWGPLQEAVTTRLQERWGDRAEIAPLRWIQPVAESSPRVPVTAGGRSAALSGVVGLSASEPARVAPLLRQGGADAPTGLARGWVYLPPEILGQLGVQPGDEVLLRGIPLRAGTFDPEAMGGALTLGGELVTPLAPDALDPKQLEEQKRIEAMDGTGVTSPESTTPIHLPPGVCAFVHESVVRDLGGTLRALAVVPRSRAVDPMTLSEEIAQEIALTLRVGAAGETTMVTAVDRLSVSGLGAVLVPLILGGLIIFSTMLNSVAERGREIFVYASLGLAPIHVGALFLVEAAIYAIIGGMGGYIIAQLVVAALGVAAAQGWVAQPDLNYSSFTAVATILLVMATVLASALYPAWMASRAATPGGTSDFRLPTPDGDLITCDLPFTVPEMDARGVAAFICDHFQVHSEASAGSFTAGEARIEDGPRPTVTARIWLAPFDLGISQRLRLELAPSDMRGIMTVRMHLEMLSGQRGDWLRANHAFIKDLRLQFLVWRTLSPEVQDRYRGTDHGGQA